MYQYEYILFICLHESCSCSAEQTVQARTKQSNNKIMKETLLNERATCGISKHRREAASCVLRQWCALLPFRCFRIKALKEAWHTSQRRLHLLIFNAEGEYWMQDTSSFFEFWSMQGSLLHMDVEPGLWIDLFFYMSICFAHPVWCGVAKGGVEGRREGCCHLEAIAMAAAELMRVSGRG